MGAFDGKTVGVLEYEVFDLPMWDAGTPGSNSGTTLAQRQKPNGYFVYANMTNDVAAGGGWAIISMADGSWEVMAEGGVDKIVSINSPPYVKEPGILPSYAFVDADDYTAISLDGGDYGFGPTKFKLGFSDEGNKVPLVDFLRWLCIAAGYTEDQISITGLDDVRVYGASLTDDTDLESILNGLSQVYAFDYYNGGDYVKIIKRDETAAASISAEYTVDDLIPLDAEKTISTKRLPPEKVAASVSISYIDYDADFADASQTAKRTVYPIATAARNQAETSINVPVVMSATEAATAALRALYASGAQNITNEFLLPWIGIQLEPSDIVKLTIGQYQYLVKLNEATVNGDLSISCAGTNFTAKFNALLDVQGITSVPTTAVKVTRSRVLIFDTPAFIAGADSSGGVAYMVTIPRGDDWNGAVEYKAIGSETPSVVRTLNAVVSHMIVENAPDDVGALFATDRDNVLTVRRVAGPAPVACTEDEARAGTNYAIYGNNGRWEFIHFSDVTSLGSSRYELRTLLRGRNGTEMYVNEHQPNDVLILMSDIYTDAILYSFGQIGQTLVGVASNAHAQTRAETDQSGLQLTAANMKPFAPANPSLTMDGTDAVIAWVRRDRVYSDIVDGSDTTPMSEWSEAYELEIYDADGNRKRLVSGLTSPTFTYTSDMQTADVIDVSTGVHVVIYQMSEQVGRGFPCDKVLYAIE